MSNNYNGPDDATQPVVPRPPYGQQGKPIVGNAYTPPQQSRSARQPYQYPGQPEQNVPYTPGAHQQAGAPPVAPPYRQPGQGQQPGQLAGRPGQAPTGKKKKGRRGCMIGCLGVLTILVILIIITATTLPRVLDFGRTISTKDPLSTETGYMGTSTRTNLLIMGYGGGDHPGANLTDSLVTVSMIPSSAHTSLVSLPRDLWVQYPPESGAYTKINSVYAQASGDGENRVAGAEAAANKISTVTGLDVKYWMMIDFNGFEKLIDSIGGIDVYVPNAFTSDYPKNDNPDIDPTVIQVQFTKGQHHFTGKQAIQYARARYIKDNPAEAGDFARAARQQIIIKSTLSTMQQSSNWPKLLDAMDAMKGAIYTNMSLIDLALYARKMDLNDPKTAKISLNFDNVMTDGYSDDGQSIVVPKDNDWDAVKQYVQKNLYA